MAPPLLTEMQAAKLREFLRACRAGAGSRGRPLPQRDVAAAAGLSLSFYKKLERGVSGAVRVERLLRVATVLGLDSRGTARLFALARPDLARLARSHSTRGLVTRRLRQVRDLATQLAESQTRRAAFDLALHAIQSLLNDDAITFLVRVRGPRTLQVTQCVGSASVSTPVLRARTFTAPAALRRGQQWAAFGASLWTVFPETTSVIGSVVCTPIRVSGELIAGLAVAKRADAPFGFADVALVETVALVLEAALERRALGR